MKTFAISIVAMILVFTSTFSQAPNTISWQGILQDAQGNNLTGNHNLTVKLFEVATGGTAVWTETHNSVAVDNGLVNLTLGSEAPFNISFDKQYWLEITIGENTPLPRMKLSSVPYSLYSKKSSGVIENDSLVLKDANGVTRMILNPNTGTFKMMNNDTTWYEVSVQSPPRTSILADGTFTISDGNTQKRYSSDGILLSEKTEYNLIDINTGMTEEIIVSRNYSGQNLLTSEKIISTRYDQNSGTTITETKSYFDNEGKKFLENETEKTHSFVDNSDIEKSTVKEFNSDGSVKSKSIFTYDKGKIIKEEKFINGIKIYEQNYDKDKSEYIEYGQGGSVYKTISNYNNELKWEAKSENKSSTQSQTHTKWTYKFDDNSQYFLIENGYGNGYKLGIAGGNTTNPSLEFVPDNNGGYNRFSGKSVFLNDIVSNQNISGINANFDGDLSVTGSKNFRIDHPEDPENKYLLHASIESDEVLNQYSGNVITDENGIAIVNLPSYVEKINTDFRYQLTVIGEFAQAIIWKKISNNQFTIKTDKPFIEVSWLVTARRNDKYIQEHPFVPVLNK